MNPSHLRRNEMLLNQLASEYVLGTLRGGARRRFERWINQDAVIRQTVVQWQTRLNPLAEFVPAVPPSPKVWAAIEKQLELAPLAKRSWLQRISEDLRFWRRLSFASSAMAAVLLAVLLVREPNSASGYPSHIATLTDERNQAVLLAAENPASREVTVQVLASPNIAPDRDLELWAITPDGKPRSLGLVPAQGRRTLQLPSDLAPGEAPVLAVSLEPRGGAPAGSGPTGPVLFKGQWIPVQG
jgi:anti-sigma-K factor RskA